jgi:hypothetical protein
LFACLCFCFYCFHCCYSYVLAIDCRLPSPYYRFG